MKAKLIVIEGLDGSGKSTQFELLKNEGLNCGFVTFPNYGSFSGRIISEYLSGALKEPSALTSAYSAASFYAIDRYLSYKSEWENTLKSGKNIIAARYTTSNAVYQMAKLDTAVWEEFLEWLYDYEYNKLSLPRPDLVLYLNMPLEESQRLLDKRYNTQQSKDIHENDIPFLNKCKKAAEFVGNKDNWHKINCVENKQIKSKEVILSEIVKEIYKCLNLEK
ncbi:MAG: deoxynucleoside kinase [Oscillospiraceae bacterium]|nr:deoxynucleoside kinase [Oscillospiraceae bacterium]